ncbi:subtilisin family serine protease [Anaerotaenia torta]|uniref:S8 family peptidase n=1 Tax=Anaerotaenia torta TaxID=433293 RepID=UPI003D1F3FC6
MTEQERERIISNEYADLLINYSGDLSILTNFYDATVQIINFFTAVVHVPVNQITNTTVMSLGYSVMPSMFGLISRASLEASGIPRIRSVPNFNLRGQGVLVGILDSGIDYLNPVFRRADNTTKIVSIWDQTIVSDNFPEGANYGTEYDREEINAALQSQNPYEIVPTVDEIGHGTMIAGIAAGNEVPESDFYGVAPDAELVVVKLKQAKEYMRDFFRIPPDVPCYQENDILFAVDYLMRVASRLQRPMAVCFALGTSQGAHDGRGTLSSYISLQAENMGYGFLVAAGNEGNARRHYYGTIDPDTGYNTMELLIGENEPGFSMEIWGDSGGVFSIDIQTPLGEYVPQIVPRLDENRDVTFIFERTEIQVDYQVIESQSGDQLILIRFRNPSPGIWRFNVYGRGTLSRGFHSWLPMQGFISENTYFVRSDPYTTILSLGNAVVPITVTAYNVEDGSLYLNSSRGFTRTGVIKPEIAAPGVGIVAPVPGGGFREVTGTSASAAHTTGVAAMLLEWAIVRGNQPSLNTLDMKIFMIRGARRELNIRYPNRDWGYGILDVYNIFDSLRIGAM